MAQLSVPSRTEHAANMHGGGRAMLGQTERTDSEFGMLHGSPHPRQRTGAATARDKTGTHALPPLSPTLRHSRRHASAPSPAITRSCTQQEPRTLWWAWTQPAPAAELSALNAASRLQVARRCRSRTRHGRSRVRARSSGTLTCCAPGPEPGPRRSFQFRG